MDHKTFKHNQLYKITLVGRITPDFPRKGTYPIRLAGPGESVWFVGLVWNKNNLSLERTWSKQDHTRFFLVASNFYKTKTIRVVYDEDPIKKKYRVKQIEPFTIDELPLLIGTKTTTLLDLLLKKDKRDTMQYLLYTRINLFTEL